MNSFKLLIPSKLICEKCILVKNNPKLKYFHLRLSEIRLINYKYNFIRSKKKNFFSTSTHQHVQNFFTLSYLKLSNLNVSENKFENEVQNTLKNASNTELLESPWDQNSLDILAKKCSTDLSDADIVQMIQNLIEDQRIDAKLPHNLFEINFSEMLTNSILNNSYIVLQASLYKKFRDFEKKSKLANKIIPLLESTSFYIILRFCKVYGELRVFNYLLFDFANKKIIRQFEKNSGVIGISSCIQILKCFSQQNFRSTHLLSLIQDYVMASNSIDSEAAVQIYYYNATLNNLDKNYMSHLESKFLDSIPNLKLESLSYMIQSFFLFGIENNYTEEIKSALNLVPEKFSMFKKLLEQGDKSQFSFLHRHFLLVRSYLKYLCRETYDSLSKEVRGVLRLLHKIELDSKPAKSLKFTDKMSLLLKKLRIGHYCYVSRGPFEFDIIERDRRLIWLCNPYHRFYAGTLEKTSQVKLNERVMKGMGYRIASCHYWQWGKMKAKRSRIEFIRMSRYYALRDRREFDSEFENWSLPHIHWLHKKAKSIHFDGYYPQNKTVVQSGY